MRLLLPPPSVPRPPGSHSFATGPAVLTAPATAGDGPEGSWMTCNRTLEGVRYPPQGQITRENVARLRRTCG